MGRVGVLLLNLGGPDKLEDVQPFLYNLFSDPEIIRLPFSWLQKPLAWFISTRRSKTSQENYRKIGGGSPLRQITEAQGEALKAQLSQELGGEANIYVGMRYWHPYTEEAIADIIADGISELVILPLYPQFSISTSGSSYRLLEKLWQENPKLEQIKYSVIASWYKQPGYLQAMAELIAQELDQLANPDEAHIFFSAHGVPKSYVEAGDPYQQEIEECTDLILQTLNRPNPHTLAYQSRVGPVEWLQPYTEDAIEDLAHKDVKNLVVVPISFVSEHIETLEEIDIEYREVAEEAGIENFRRVPALNVHPVFIQALANLTLDALKSPSISFAEVNQMKKKVKIYPPERWEWGITTSAEVWNGRIAMLGFIALMIEILTGHGLLHAVGLL